MRVLLAHKFMFRRAGAETSFFQTRELLGARGHEVVDFAMEHPDNEPSPYAEYFVPRRDYSGEARPDRRARDALASVYSVRTRLHLRRLLAEHRPDVAHLHNVYHQMTLSVVDELVRARVPVVLTVHDWKIACPAYTLYTEGAPCRRCVGGSVLNAVRHRCIKGSTGASALGAAEAALERARGTYEKVDRFIAPSRFAAEVVTMTGIASARVDVVPNFVTEDLRSAPATSAVRPVFLYAGRLDETKGIRSLLRAFADVRADATLRIAGDGPLAAEVAKAATRDPRIEVLGRLDHRATLQQMTEARALVLPSVWEDNGPYVILEAQATGRAMVVTDRGGPPEFVVPEESGLVVDPEDPATLTAALERLARDPVLAARLGAGGRARVDAHHTADRHYHDLVASYERAMAGAT